MGEDICKARGDKHGDEKHGSVKMGDGALWELLLLKRSGKLSLRTFEQRSGRSEGSAVHTPGGEDIPGRRKSSETSLGGNSPDRDDH